MFIIELFVKFIQFLRRLESEYGCYHYIKQELFETIRISNLKNVQRCQSGVNEG